MPKKAEREGFERPAQRPVSHCMLYAAFLKAAVALELSSYVTVHVVSLAAGCLTITDSGGASYFSPACLSSLSYLL